MASIVLIRHGETDWNVEGRYQGQADPPLNSKGLHQAHQLAHELINSAIDVLFTSPLKRTRQTAEIISRQLGIMPIDDPRYMEIDQGDWQTRLRSDIENLYPDLFNAWQTDPWKVTPPGGEHLSEVQSRVYAALDDSILEYSNQKIGIVTHRIPIALIKVRYQGMDPDIVRTIHLPNAYWEEIPISDDPFSSKFG